MLEKKDLELIAVTVETAMQPILGKLQILEGKVSRIEEDVSVLKEDVSVLKEDVSVLKEDVSGLKSDVSSLKSDVACLKERMDDVDARLRRVELTLENETNRNILFIAEGHLDLSRKLNESIKLGQDALAHVEKFEIRQVHFDNELTLMKERLTQLEQQNAIMQVQTA